MTTVHPGKLQVKVKESATADDVGNTHDASKLISIGEEFNGNLLTSG